MFVSVFMLLLHSENCPSVAPDGDVLSALVVVFSLVSTDIISECDGDQREAALCCDWAHFRGRGTEIQAIRRGSMREAEGEYCWWTDGTSAITPLNIHRQDILLSLTFYVLFKHLLGPPDPKNRLCVYNVCVFVSVTACGQMFLLLFSMD